MYQRADDGIWSLLEGVVLSGTFDGHISDKAIIIPNENVGLVSWGGTGRDDISMQFVKENALWKSCQVFYYGTVRPSFCSDF